MLPDAMPAAAAVAPELRGARRILAVRLDNVGDVVLLSPALRALSRALPGAEITLLASRAGAQVAPLVPWVDDVMVARPVWQDVFGAVPFDPEREIAFARSLADRAFDAAFVFTSFNQAGEVPGYVTYLAGIPVRVGHAALFSGGVFSHPVPPPPNAAHAADRNLALVEALGVPVAGRSLELCVPARARAEAADLLAARGLDPAAPYVVAAPGASCEARRYPPERFGEVLRGLAAETGLPVAVVGHERESEIAARALAVAGPDPDAPIVSLVGATSLATLAALIERAELLVANDSGPMHIADAFGRPQLVLFSGTELESQWAPRRSPLALLRRPTPCSPCYRQDCPYQLACLDIPPSEVVERGVALLDETSAPGDVASATHGARRPALGAIQPPTVALAADHSERPATRPRASVPVAPTSRTQTEDRSAPCAR